MISAPCKDCSRRQVGCHSNCEDYAKFKQEKEISNARERAEFMGRQIDFNRHNRLRKYRGRK